MLFSVLALYNYDNTIFDNLQPNIPTKPSNTSYAVLNYTPIDFEVLKNLILLRAAELSIVYTDVDLFKLSLSMWSKSCKDVWQRLYDTMWLKYDPLFSKIRTYTLERNSRRNADNTESTTQEDNRTIDRGDKTVVDRDVNTASTYNNNESNTVSQTDYNTEHNNETDTQYVQAFNDIGEGSWHEKEKNTHVSDTSANGNRNINSNGNESGVGNIDTDEDVITDYQQDVKDLLNRTIRKSGNLVDTGKIDDVISETIKGQIPYQELILLQREIAQFNLYEYIVEDFVSRFCVMVY